MLPTIGTTRAFLYARSACESQNASMTKADKQLQYLRKGARDRSYVVVGEACDVGTSGNSLSRSGLSAVISSATCTPPIFDVLLVTDLSRFARDIRLLTAITSSLTSAGIRIEVISEPFECRDEG
jgi:DNA invertase Pin-like site-specific DNA recombinase